MSTSGIVEKGLAPTKQVFLLLFAPSVTTILIFLAIFSLPVFLCFSLRYRRLTVWMQLRVSPHHLVTGAMTFILRPEGREFSGPGLTLSSRNKNISRGSVTLQRIVMTFTRVSVGSQYGQSEADMILH